MHLPLNKVHASMIMMQSSSSSHKWATSEPITGAGTFSSESLYAQSCRQTKLLWMPLYIFYQNPLAKKSLHKSHLQLPAPATEREAVLFDIHCSNSDTRLSTTNSFLLAMLTIHSIPLLHITQRFNPPTQNPSALKKQHGPCNVYFRLQREDYLERGFST